MQNGLIISLLLAGLIAAGFASPKSADFREKSSTSGTVIYVDDDAPAGGDGTSWNTAFKHLQDALAVAQPGDELRIAQGTYKPDQGAGQVPGNREARFLVSNIAVRGGYAGIGAPDPDERDIENYRTVLSGDLLENDGPGPWENYGDNSRQLMRVNDTSASTLIEGLTFRAANNIALQDPIHQFGGGMRCDGGSPQILHCSFERNQAKSGGGIFLFNCSGAVIDHCIFHENRCTGGPFGFGGGLYVEGGACAVTDTIFLRNRADSGDGGGAATFGNVSFHRCSFRQNFSDQWGGAFRGSPQMYDCEFIDNNGYQGGAIVAGGGLVMRCLFQRNLAAHEGGAILGKPTVIDSRFIENEIIWNGGAGIWGGGTVINCEFTRNRTPYFADWGGAAVVNARPIGGKNLTGPGTYINCVFNGNQTVGRGGAAYVDLMQTGTFINCTFTANSALGANGALHAHANSQAVVRNCIMWNNSPDEIGGPGQISVQYSSVQGGWPGQGNIAMNPLFVDPLGPDGIPGTGDEDLRLAPGSPCIDSGNNLALPPDTYDLNGNGNVTEPLPIDKDGNLRRINDPATPNTGHPPGASVIVDMGAYEFNDFRPLLGDVTGDGVVNVNDLLGVINSWGPCPAFPQHCPADLDQNGVVNHHDLLIVIQNWG